MLYAPFGAELIEFMLTRRRTFADKQAPRLFLYFPLGLAHLTRMHAIGQLEFGAHYSFIR